MKTNAANRWFYGLILLLVIFACKSGSQPAAPTSVPALPPTGPAPGSPPTEKPVSQHEDIPVHLPYERVNKAGDQDSSQTADQKRAPGGDRFTYGQFERPFNANTMDMYYPNLDIQNTVYYEDDEWIYSAITLKGRDENDHLSGKYGFEIDSNLDGRGEWLVLVANPSTAEWSTDGIQVWFDANGDVGGTTPFGADEDTSEAGDGYESLLVDQGQGDDPDLAWARISAEDPNTVELAVKLSLLNGDTSYIIGAWAGSESLDPALFDLNDHFTHEQAGAALIDLENFYPIKALAGLDNACRVSVGFTPAGSEPGLCVTNPPKKVACDTGQFVCIPFAEKVVCFCVH